MSVSASIGFRVIDSQLRMVASPVKIIKALVSNQWNVHHDGSMYYIPLGYQSDDFDWKIETMDMESFIKIISEKEERGEIIGVNLLWQNTYIGGSLLFWSEKEALQENIHTPMSFSLSSDRKILVDHGSFNITDVNWYLTRLLPALHEDDMYVASYTYEEDK